MFARGILKDTIGGFGRKVPILVPVEMVKLTLAFIKDYKEK